MKTVQEIFATAGVENATLQAEVESLIATAESKKSDGIPKSRFNEKITECNNLRADVTELESKLETANKKIETQTDTIKELKGYKTELETFKAKELETFGKQFNDIVKQLTVEETDPKFKQYKTVLDKFKLGSDETPLTADEIKSNLEIYNLAKEFGGLDLKDNEFDDGKTPKGAPSIKSPYEEALTN